MPQERARWGLFMNKAQSVQAGSVHIKPCINTYVGCVSSQIKEALPGAVTGQAEMPLGSLGQGQDRLGRHWAPWGQGQGRLGCHWVPWGSDRTGWGHHWACLLILKKGGLGAQ